MQDMTAYVVEKISRFVSAWRAVHTCQSWQIHHVHGLARFRDTAVAFEVDKPRIDRALKPALLFAGRGLPRLHGHD